MRKVRPIVMNIDADTVDVLDGYAQDFGLSRSMIVRQALREFVDACAACENPRSKFVAFLSAERARPFRAGEG